MPIWKDLNISNRKLYLPQLSDGITGQDIYCSDTELYITVDSEFIDLWHQSPKSVDDPDELDERIRILGRGLNRLIKEGQGRVKIQTKQHANDWVTEMDRGIEMLIRIWLSKHYPTHKIIGEEGRKDHIEKDDYVWYLDPVDGTHNFIDQSPDVSLHMACLKSGLPFASFVGLPFYDTLYTLKTSFPEPHFSETLSIGTEYLSHRINEKEQYEQLLHRFSASAFTKRAIGIHLIRMMQGEVQAFYKPQVKLWDIIAPCSIMQYSFSHLWDIKITYNKNTLLLNEAIEQALFSEDLSYIQHLNTQHQGNCRIGLLSITPKTHPELHQAFLEHSIEYR